MPSSSSPAATYISTIVQHTLAYIFSKPANSRLMKTIAMELAPRGIRLNSLSPGYSVTDLTRGLQTKQLELVKQYDKKALFGRTGYPDKLKGGILLL